MSQNVNGFSKLSLAEKKEWFNRYLKRGLDLDNLALGKTSLEAVRELTENVISYYPFPYSIAPHFLINGENYCVPMVIEESSVVAAAASGAKFWRTRGGIKTRVIGQTKVGQIHFFWQGKSEKLFSLFETLKTQLLEKVSFLTEKMEQRGGGIKKLKLIDLTPEEKNYYQIYVTFNTCDAMGANFINSVLEEMAYHFSVLLSEQETLSAHERQVDILMCILSNYVPECLVEAKVRCPVKNLGIFRRSDNSEMSASEFAKRFVQACHIARIDRNRAVTHNKGIMNGIDALCLATANDFRALEAGAHAYASHHGTYRSLSEAQIEREDGEDFLCFSLKIPLSIGTIGGASGLHPMAQLSLEILRFPDAQKLMEIMAAVGLAQNFTAVKCLVTTGIQRGHMQLHLLNILNQLDATPNEVKCAREFFIDKQVSFSLVRDFVNSLRKIQ